VGSRRLDVRRDLESSVGCCVPRGHQLDLPKTAGRGAQHPRSGRLGAVWGLFAGLWLGAWLQFLVLPLYIALGVVAATNSASIGPGHPHKPLAGFSPGPVVAPPPQPSFCPACGTSLMTGAAFCQACGARVAPVATQ
jgi:hypothetical protein